MRRRINPLFIFGLVLTIMTVSCSKDGGDSDSKKKRGHQLAPRQGVWRALKLLEASLNHRNYPGYLKVFSGAARRAIRKEMSAPKFKKSVQGRYKLAAFHIVKRHSRSLVTVKYAFRQYLPGKKVRVNPGQGTFAAHKAKGHWVIISFK